MSEPIHPIRRRIPGERLEVRLSLMVTPAMRSALKDVAVREGLAMNVILRLAIAAGLPVVDVAFQEERKGKS